MNRREARDKCLEINQNTWTTGISAKVVRILPENQDPYVDSDSGWNIEIRTTTDE